MYALGKNIKPSDVLPASPRGRELVLNWLYQMKLVRILPVMMVFALCSVSFAGEADVLNVEVKKTRPNTYQFNITIFHKDEGWDHYANKWDIIAPDGTLLGTRTLHHPHVNEQPFTRNLSDVKIPKKVKAVTVRANDSIHGYGGKVVRVKLPQ